MEWSLISHTQFEKLTFSILSYNSFLNIEWHGNGGGDKGRDIVAYTFERLPLNLGYKRKWIFQCKK
ncbi:hypothetical protein KQI88_15340 [Alkaliphilus sp. MSJ-5]|uniref:Uncharacterized protein n=1 Tax=Alkaliphilus flagellatus TaxID=2841507 RepID=A0ABS6G7T8_9FIRM|nr:hypothetical protein [Alkaliphilus flagellatus]MBU5677792.1 hypothetical protein [Alkaliphilus flagellatus]